MALVRIRSQKPKFKEQMMREAPLRFRAIKQPDQSMLNGADIRNLT